MNCSLYGCWTRKKVSFIAQALNKVSLTGHYLSENVVENTENLARSIFQVRVLATGNHFFL